MGYWDGYYPKYVSVAEKKAKAAKKLAQLKKKNPSIQPVILTGNKLARTWWGKSWNTNLERYADYSNRIGRGRSYVRHGAVLDLQILPGEIRGLVQGSRSNPYSVVIKIEKLDNQVWDEIKNVCEGKLDSLTELLAGKFPKDLEAIFMAKGRGLFPSPKEIRFDCSCPDWASMCKHVAAVLYGVGARLDEDPGLFFKLRKIDMNDLITRAVAEKTQKLIKKSEKKTERVIDDADISGMFGIEMDEPVLPEPEKPKSLTTPSGKKKPAKVATTTKKKTPLKKASGTSSDKKAAKKTTVAKRTAKKDSVKKATAKPAKKSAKKLSITDRVTGIIRRSRKGVTIKDIVKKTGLQENQVRNAVYTIKKQGKIKSEKRGVYIGN